MLKTILLLTMFVGLSAQAPAPAPAYAEGQVWDYRTRPGEEGSLLKIQRIEPWPMPDSADRVYHISVIGVRVGGATAPLPLPHLPVSRETLDVSVTGLSRSTAAFPSPEEGIGEWRAARGGIFTIPMAAIVAVVDEALTRQRAAVAPPVG
jgi:hypothetical protein